MPRTGSVVTAATAVAVLLGCSGSARDDSGAPGEAAHPAKAAPLPERLGLGRAATPARLAALDIDVNPSGVGLPPGEGTVVAGAAVYAARCAVCHGPRGEGIATFPALVGREPRDGFPFGNDVKLVKTVGNYWPHATTLYDYIHRAMPYTAPGSLTPPEVYGLVAYLLAENGIVPRTFIADSATVPRVVMPARGRFVRDDRAGGTTFR